MKMAFQVSPGINVSEVDLTTVVPAVSTTEGAFAGVFRWGPVDKLVLVSSEDDLVNRFGRPTNHNAETYFTAANFLAYGNKLYVSRAANVQNDEATGNNNVTTAVANTSSVSGATLVQNIVKNEDHYETVTFDSGVQWVARYPGDLGNTLKISVCDSSNQYTGTINLASDSHTNTIYDIDSANIAFVVGSNSATITISSNTGTGSQSEAALDTILAFLSVGDYLEAGNSTIGKQYLKITAIGASTIDGTDATSAISFENKYGLSVNVSSQDLTRYWEYYNVVDAAPGQSTYQGNFGNTSANDEIHVVVSDDDGKFTGVPGTILEVYNGLSRATDAKSEDGTSNYYKTIINQNSRYVWWANARSGAVSNTALNIVSSTNSTPYTKSFVDGSDGDAEDTVSIATITSAYDKFRSSEDVEISLLLTGKARGGTNGEQLANYLIDNIAEIRKDCVVFLSPDRADVVNNSGQDEEQDIKTFRDSVRSTSYAVLDSGYKYQYDKYNDIYRYVPLNGDVAGLCVRTDEERDPWFSPGGFNRGQIKNIIKLAFNPNKAERDVLYKSGINPVVTFPGQGTILFGDKTLLAKPSAFDRINVRRLFIVLEKAIATAAKFTLFEFNDEFTRAQFKNLVEPFLRDVQGRRGIYDFRVVCDDTNNTGEVIDRNEFVGDIYIKPARSINFIQLNFVAVRTGVEFSEVVGQF
jgi:hypothetical protein